MIARGATDLLLPYVGPDNIWRGYSGENVIYDGIPRAGLVCWHDLYDPTASLASVPDLSGNGYALRLGSTAGADSNDPAWAAGGKGLVFTTDDYALTGNLSGVDMAGDWTVVLVAKSVYTADSYFWGFATAANDNNWFAMRWRTAAEVQLDAKATTSASTSAIVAPNDGTIATFVAKSSGGVQSIRRMDTGGVSGTTISKAPTGTPRIGIGTTANSTLAGSEFRDGAVYSHLFYNCALSDAELKRIYPCIKATWAARGVTIQ